VLHISARECLSSVGVVRLSFVKGPATEPQPHILKLPSSSLGHCADRYNRCGTTDGKGESVSQRC